MPGNILPRAFNQLEIFLGEVVVIKAPFLNLLWPDIASTDKIAESIVGQAMDSLQDTTCIHRTYPMIPLYVWS